MYILNSSPPILLLRLILLLPLIPFSTASPVASPSPSTTSSTLSAGPPTLGPSRPPKKPVCPPDFAPRPPRTRWFAKNCEEAIKLIPRDTRPASPVRNFYLLERDRSAQMPNVQLPAEWENGMCQLWEPFGLSIFCLSWAFFLYFLSLILSVVPGLGIGCRLYGAFR